MTTIRRLDYSSSLLGKTLALAGYTLHSTVRSSDLNSPVFHPIYYEVGNGSAVSRMTNRELQDFIMLLGK